MSQSNSSPGSREPRWPPRVKKSALRRLYESEAAGLMDEELLEDVGITLWMRCRAILDVARAVAGQVICPHCQQPIPLQHGADGEPPAPGDGAP